MLLLVSLSTQRLGVSSLHTAVAMLEDASLASGEAMLKRFYREARGTIRLQPANATMAPFVVAAHTVEIQGKVIGMYRTM